MLKLWNRLSRHLHPNWLLHLLVFTGYIWLIWSYA